jgi:MFS family permease
MGAFLQAAGNVIPLYYLTTYSTSVLAYPSSTGSLLLALNSAVNSVSRLGMGFLADRVGRQNTMVLSVCSTIPLLVYQDSNI